MSRDDSGSFLRLPGAGNRQEESVRLDRPDRRRPADEDRGREGPHHSAGHQARHLRRTRRRSGSVKFCHRIGLTYVSCSPFRVPVARLAAAQAALEEEAASKALSSKRNNKPAKPARSIKPVKSKGRVKRG